MSDTNNTENSITVETGSRLHFGLLSFGNATGRQFGGAGVMIDDGGVTLEIYPAQQFDVVGPLADRVRELVSQYVASESLSEEPFCRLELVEAPRHHVGLGTGTQLGLAVAAGLDAFRQQSSRAVEGLASSVGRGLRSAVGAYGFEQGGFIYEKGKLASEVLSPLEARVELPADWRFVLFCDSGRQGLSGASERESFAQLPAVASDVTSQLQAEIEEQMIPAALSGDFEAFSDSVYRYGCLAGACYESGQGGVFASQEAQQLVDAIRAVGTQGVGQSSWGPTIFALTRSESEAAQLIEKIAASGDHQAWEANVAAVRNVGASITATDFSAPSANG